jgi:peptide/nickel transport system substrate-binding protein
VTRSADRRRITVRLRRGVRWHDGRPLTAEDVAFTFRHLIDRPHPRFTPQIRDVADVAATDSHTIELSLRRPSLGFEDQPLADVPILPRHLWQDLPRERLAPPGPPIGSGPYRLAERRRGELYRFEANRRYFRGRPLVQRIDVPIIRRPEATFDALEQGDVDAIPVNLTSEALGQLRGSDVRVASGRAYLGTVLMFNTRRPPFDRLAVRRAVAEALDLERIVRTLGAGAGERIAIPAERGYLHPSSPWAAPRDLHRFDATAARVALAELALPEVQVLAPRNDPLRLEAGRQVVLALRRAGARAALRRVSAESLARAVGQDGFGANFEAAIWSTPALASYDPAFLAAVFGNPAAPLNYPGYRSIRFQRLAGEVDAAATRGARRRAVAAELRQLARDLPVVPLFFAEGQFAYRPGAYEAWTYVHGSGILDKRSFLPHRRPRGRAPAVGDPVDRGGSSSGSGYLLAAALLVGLVLLAAAVRAGAAVAARGRRR